MLVGSRLAVATALRRAASALHTSAAAAAAATAVTTPAAGVVRVAGIESSCDDSGVGIVEVPTVAEGTSGGGRVVADVLAAQWHLHAPYAGIVPHFAARAHAVALPHVWQRACDIAARQPLDAIGVTVGPGLAPCLSAGLAFARSRVAAGDAPLLIPVNHLDAHVAAARRAAGVAAVRPPYLVLLVSGGHTLLAAVGADGAMARLATTGDDAIGECFDKVARTLQVWRYPPRRGEEGVSPPRPGEGGGVTRQELGSDDVPQLNLAALVAGAGRDGGEGGAARPLPLSFKPPVPVSLPKHQQQPHGVGTVHLGAALEALAAEGDAAAIRFPVPLRGVNVGGASGIGFSFSGLKSALARYIATAAAAASSGGDWLPRATAANIAASFQAAAVTHIGDQLARALAYTTVRAAAEGTPPVTAVVVAGGVAANAVVRQAVTAVAAVYGATAAFPPPALCTDNGVMVAWAAADKLAAAGGAGAGPDALRRAGIWVSPAASPVTAHAPQPTLDILPRLPLGAVPLPPPRAAS